MAIHDVTQEFARTMKAENLSGLDTDKLIGFRIFNVNPQFIRELRAVGLPAREADTLIAFRVHEVTPEIRARIAQERHSSSRRISSSRFACTRSRRNTSRRSKRWAWDSPDADQLIALRVHDVTPEYIAEMKSRGLKNLTIDRLVELKMHGID